MMPGEGKAKRRAVVFPVSQQFLSESLVSQSLFECESSAIIKVTVQLAAGNPEEEEEMCAVKQGGAWLAVQYPYIDNIYFKGN